MGRSMRLFTVLVLGCADAIIIDFKTREILDRWIIRVDSLPPNIVLKYSIKAPVGEASQTNFEYTNPAIRPVEFEFTTSHPEVFHILQRECLLGTVGDCDEVFRTGRQGSGAGAAAGDGGADTGADPRLRQREGQREARGLVIHDFIY